MGNCLGFKAADEPNPSSTNSIRPSTPGTFFLHQFSAITFFWADEIFMGILNFEL